MITSNDCWVKNECKLYNNPHKECECRTDNIFCIKLFKLHTLYKNSLLPENMWAKTVFKMFPSNEIDRKLYVKLSEFESNIKENIKQGKNLYIHSEICGNGKTSWAVRMLQSYLSNVWYESDLSCKALFINVPRFFLSLKDSISNQSEYIDHIKKYVLTADLVIWDEVGVKSLTPYEHEHLLSLINARLDAGKSNIYTSNLPAEELAEKVGDRLYSRIFNLSDEIYFQGEDRRIKNGSTSIY